MNDHTLGPGHARAFAFWIVVATLGAAALRLYHLDVAGFWVDEIYTLQAAADLRDMHNSKVLGYLPTWLGLWLSGVNPAAIPARESAVWLDAGVTHTSARLGSVLVGIVTVPALAMASRRLLGGGGAVMLALLIATSPWHIYWSQAARFYSVQFLFYTLALIFYFTATRTNSRPQFVMAMVFVVLAFLSQPTALSILAIFGADWLIAIWRRRPLRLTIFHWTIGTTAVAFCAAIVITDYFGAPDEWAPFVSFGGAAYQPPHRLGMGAVYMTGPAVVLGALATAWGIRRDQERLVIYLLLAAILPIAIFAAWSLFNAVGLRYLLICLFGWLGLAAIGLDRLATLIHARSRSTALALAPLGVLIVSSAHLLVAYYTNAYGFHPRWPEAYKYVAAHVQPGDIIAARHPIVGQYYLQHPSVEHLPLNPQQLADLGSRVWLIVESRGGSDGDIGPWISAHTNIRRSLELSTPQPISRVDVLLYEQEQIDDTLGAAIDIPPAACSTDGESLAQHALSPQFN